MRHDREDHWRRVFAKNASAFIYGISICRDIFYWLNERKNSRAVSSWPFPRSLKFNFYIVNFVLILHENFNVQMYMEDYIFPMSRSSKKNYILSTLKLGNILTY